MSFQRRIELFYDVVSPYSYFAFETILRYCSHHQIELSLRPFFLGGVMQAAGNKPPGLVPSKGKYMLKDLNRLQDYFGVHPLKYPSRFPINTLPAQRTLAALNLAGRKEEGPLAIKLWEYYWGQDQDISNLEVIQKALEAVGISSEEAVKILATISSDEVKEAIKKTTEEAVKRGAFGAPTMFVFSEDGKKEEMFFGSDRFHILFPKIGVKWTGPNPKESKM
eukprot:TRINITY_DN3137_c0_g1_i1.p1 TRINITY_DN3137_c0_g1~~TRINITY_DN3137_c0_g1_i1.p1  ORF type:complete len:222 (-),score=53.85 TRINITY_DN3137_c0_g1_i1:58-723(-)